MVVVFAYDGIPGHLDLAICAPLDIVEKDLSCLKATPKELKGQHLESGNLKMYDRNKGKALAIPLTEFGNNNCSA